MKKITLGTYPYAATRVKVMKTALIQKEVYAKLMKMQMSGISQFLQENGYRAEMNELAIKYSGVDLIEQAVNRNSASTYKKIRRLSSGGLAAVVDAFLKRFDAYNIKTILRGKLAGASHEEIMASLIIAGDLDAEFLASVAKKDTIQQAVLALNPPKAVRDAVRDFENSGSIIPLENAIDREYYREMYAMADLLPKEGRLLKELMKAEIDSGNIRALLRMKKAGIDAKEIKKNLNPDGLHLAKKTLERLAESKDLSELAAMLEKTYYGRIISPGIKKFREEGTLSVIETDLTKNLLRQGTLFLHQNPLSIGPIIGFSMAKEAEARNLKMIAHARHREMPERFMEDVLVA